MNLSGRWLGRLLLLAGLAVAAGAADEGKATRDAVKLGFTVDKAAAMTSAAAGQQRVLAFFTTDW